MEQEKDRCGMERQDHFPRGSGRMPGFEAVFEIWSEFQNHHE